jgi:hypothetical protein
VRHGDVRPCKLRWWRLSVKTSAGGLKRRLVTTDLFRNTPVVPGRLRLVAGDNARNLMWSFVKHGKPQQGVGPGTSLERQGAL